MKTTIKNKADIPSDETMLETIVKSLYVDEAVFEYRGSVSREDYFKEKGVLD